MKQSFIIASLAIFIILAAIPAQADIPENRRYDVERAAFSLAMTVMDECEEGEVCTVPYHYERLMLARRIVSSPGAMALKLIKMAEAKLWVDVTWTDTFPSKDSIRNNIEGVWDYVAIATYGEDPVRPSEPE